MQPEVQPTQQPQETVPQQQAVVAQAFQPTATPTQPVMQPVDPNALRALKPENHRSGLIRTILLVVALIVSLGFGIWAFSQMMDYKNNSDKKSASAVQKALTDQKIKLDAEFAEKDKQPYDTYTGKAEAGSVSVQYPRTWSAYVTEQNGATPIDGYFHPGFVPSTLGNDIAFALRVQVVDSPYSTVLKQFEGSAKQSGVSVAPYRFAKVPDTLGSVVTGKIIPSKDKAVGTMVIMPIRDKTLKVWTESNSSFSKDFNEAVLANLTFVP